MVTYKSGDEQVENLNLTLLGGMNAGMVRSWTGSSWLSDAFWNEKANPGLTYVDTNANGYAILSVNAGRVELGFILLIAVMTAVAMKIVGLLLITALLVVPAAAARRLSASPEAMAAVAAALAAVAVVSGLMMAAFADLISGPAIVLAAGLLFVLTLAVRRTS